MREEYWELFRQTGLPEAWLIWRVLEVPETVAAFGEEETGGTPV